MPLARVSVSRASRDQKISLTCFVTLSPAIVQALSPLEVDVGPEIRALHNTGYRKHAGMIRFKWHARSVEERIDAISDTTEWQQACNAYDWLMGTRLSMYAIFVQRHDDFLRACPRPDGAQRKCVLRFIEEVGLECACWPHLFWRTDMCFSFERSSNPLKSTGASLNQQEDEEARAARQQWKRPKENPYEEDEEDAHGEEGANDEDSWIPHSVRRMFQAFIMAPLVDYGASYEILHFVYDFCLWTSVGSKRNLKGADMPMRLMMKGHPISPLYWNAVHAAVIDMTRQCGYPAFFRTFAPYEWTLPYHVYMLDQTNKQERCRLQLPIHETLHSAHLMRQTFGRLPRRRE